MEHILLTTAILSAFEAFKMAPMADDQYEQTGKAVLYEKILWFISKNLPISFVMLGFPMKSKNDRDKVLGTLPDMAEQVAFQNFANFDACIRALYPPGVNMTIVSDGFIFNDILSIEDRTVEQYEEMSIDMSKVAPMTWFDMTHFYSKKLTKSTIREKIVAQFGISPEELQRRILFDNDVNYLYKGMTIFMQQEEAIKEYPSNNQRQKAAKALTREMMLRNEAYSGLVRQEFKQHIRLSMHPSVNSGAKYSFQLIPSKQGKAKHSPWHAALLLENGDFVTIHKKDAIAAGYELQYKDNRPYNFIN
jgi:pyoverdine/dityrosine biosynthesis protein Dit1